MKKLFTLLCLISAGFSFVGFSSTARTKTVVITVNAGAHDRSDAIVSFDLPEELQGTLFKLRDSRGQTVPLQVDSNRRASFILRSLKAGTSTTYTIVKGTVAKRPDRTGVQILNVQDQLRVTVNGFKVLTFVSKATSLPDPKIKPVFLRGGYIHPVYAPSGRIVTDDYPSDHYHHHGIWFAWTKTQFGEQHPDFWNVGDGSGRIDSSGGEIQMSGPVYGSFKSQQSYIALSNSKAETALTERWDVRIYNVGQEVSQRHFVFDIVATQECATAQPLKLDEYRYGGMGLRGHRDWKDKSKVSFLTSEGKTRADGNATRGRWFVMSGPVEGASVNIAVLDHPENFRSPQPMRLNPDDPFFNYAPSQLGPFEIKSGEPFVLRYRYVVADGEPKPDELNRLWNDYANEPKVTVAIK